MTDYSFSAAQYVKAAAKVMTFAAVKIFQSRLLKLVIKTKKRSKYNRETTSDAT